MKIILVLIIVCGFGYVGWGLSLYYKKRNAFFCGLILFCDKIRADINFSNKNLLEIIKVQTCDVQVGKLLNNFCEYLKDKKIELNKKQLFKGIMFLKDEEKELILNFFSRLGRHDTENEIKLIDDFKTAITPVSEISSKQVNKEAKLSIKISFLLGLMIAIVIV